MDNRELALQAMRDKRDAYLKLFGPPDDPTPYGKIVLDDLNRFCTTFSESIHMDKEGRMDPFTTIYRDGKKAVALRIHEMIRWREHGHSSPSPDAAPGPFTDGGPANSG